MIAYKKSNPEAKMKNKNIRSRQIEGSRQRAWTHMFGKKICPVKCFLPVFLGDGTKQMLDKLERSG